MASDRFEDLPAVDSEGWLADAGRNFLQQTDARISRLRLPDFMAESQRKIQGLGSDLGQMYSGLEQGLSSLPSQAQQASTNFLTSTTGRIAGLGSAVGSQLGGSIGSGLGAAGSIGDFLGSIGGAIGGSADDLTDLLERQREDEEERRRVQEEEARRRRDQLGQSVGDRFSDLGTGLSGLRDRAAGVNEGLQQRLTGVREADAPALLGAARSGLDWIDERTPELPEGARPGSRSSTLGGTPAQRNRAIRTGTGTLRTTLSNLEEGMGRIRGGLAARDEALGRGDPLGAAGETAGTLLNTALTAAEAASAPARAFMGGYGGGTLPAGSDRSLLGIPGDTPVLGGLTNPVEVARTLGDAAAPGLVVDDVLRALGAGYRAGRPVVERFVREVGEGPVRAALRQGAEAVGVRFDDFLAQAAETGQRLAGEEEGALLLPGRGRRPTPEQEAEAARARLLAPRTNTHLDDMERQRAMLVAQRAPVPEPGPTGSVLDTFRGRGSAFREKWIDENARTADVQGAVGRELRRRWTPGQPLGGRALSEEADVLSKRRLYAGRQAAQEQRVLEGIKPAIEDLSPEQRTDLDNWLLAQDQADKARATAARPGATVGVGERVGPGATRVWSDPQTEAAFRETVRQRLERELGAPPDPARLDEEVRLLQDRAKDLQGYSRSLRDRLHQAGLISDDLHQKWTTDFPHYIRSVLLEHLERGADTTVSGGPQQFSVNTLRTQGMNLAGRLTEGGSDMAREGAIDTLIRMTGIVETLSRRNEVAQSLQALIKEDPTGTLRGVFRPLKSADESVRPGEVRFTYWDKGEPASFAVPKEYQTLFQMEPSTVRKGFQVAGRALGAPLLRKGATTYNPGFVALNALRDLQVYLRREGGFRSPQAFGGALKDLGLAYRDLGAAGRRGTTDADWAALAKAGGSQSERFAGQAPKAIQQQLAGEVPGIRVVKNPADLLGAVGDVLGAVLGAVGKPIRQTGELVESAPRLAAYRRAKGRGASEAQAALAARDITLDFSRGGAWARNLNALVPFLNAAIQGNERFLMRDWAKGNRKDTAAAMFFGGVVPTVALEAYNRQYGEDYQDVPDYLKDSGLVVMLPGPVSPGKRDDGTPVPGQRQFLYLPLPQDMAVIKGTVTRALRGALGEEPTSWQQFALETLGDLSPVPLEGGVPLPPLARVPTELIANRDIFRGRDIVPEYLEHRPVGEQATDRTSAFGRVVGGAASAAGFPVAPAQVDYAVEGALGGAGRLGLQASDAAARLAGRSDLAGRGYSTPDRPGVMDALRGIPGVGDVAGRVVRSSGGQVEEYDRRRAGQEADAEKRRVRRQLERSPGWGRLPEAERKRILDEEYRRINTRTTNELRDERESRQIERAQAQRRRGG